MDPQQPTTDPWAWASAPATQPPPVATPEATPAKADPWAWADQPANVPAGDLGATFTVNGKAVTDSPVDLPVGVAKTVWGGVAPFVPGTPESKQMGQSIADGSFFVNLAKSMVGLSPEHGQEAQKMLDAAKAGDIPTAARHALGMLPLIGPYLSAEADKAVAGKPWEAAGDVIGAGILMKPGAVLPVGRVMDAAPDALVSSARTGVSKFLGATTKPLKAEARMVEQGILDRGLGKGLPTRESVLDQAVAQAGQPAEAGRQATFGAAGRAITRDEAATAAANPGPVVPAQPAIDVFDRAIARHTRTDINGNVVARAGKEQIVTQAKALKEYVEGYGDRLTFEDAAELKRDFQAVADAGKQFMADDPTKAKAWVAKRAGTAMRRELLKVNPDLQQVWSEYGFWKGVRDVLQHTQDNVRPQQNWGRRMASLGAAASGAAPGVATGSSLEAALGAATMAAVSRALQSPTWKLASAQLKNSLADAIASGNPSRVQFYLTRIRVTGGASQLARPTVAPGVPVGVRGPGQTGQE